MALLDGAFAPESLHQAAYIVAKIGIGAVLAGVVGWEREVHRRPAGMRTHIMLVIGVVLICEVSRSFGNGDPARIAAQIVTGVGFLGAGAIMRMGLEVKGLTSAASLWAVTGIGMAVSVGGSFLVVAVVATALCLFTLKVLTIVEKWAVAKAKANRLVVKAAGRRSPATIIAALAGAEASIQGMEVVQDDPDLEVVLYLMGNRDEAMLRVLAAEGVTEARWMED